MLYNKILGLNPDQVGALQRSLNADGNHLTVDNKIGELTMKAFQTELSTRGFYNGPSDGKFSADIHTAITQYFNQGNNGIRSHSKRHLKRVLATGQKPDGALSAQAEYARDVALARGQKTFIIVDKRNGQICLYKDGVLALKEPALTGASHLDSFPTPANGRRDKESLLTLNAGKTENRITPAGCLTIHTDRGAMWIDEYSHTIKTPTGLVKTGWAIHDVYLGKPSEHRDQRLASGNPNQSHISHGCINVPTGTAVQMLKLIGDQKNIPLYVLPQNEGLTAQYIPSPSANETRFAIKGVGDTAGHAQDKKGERLADKGLRENKHGSIKGQSNIPAMA